MKKQGKSYYSFIKDLKRAARLIIKAAPSIAVWNILILFLQALLPIVSLYFTKQLVDAVTSPEQHPFQFVIQTILLYSAIQLCIAFISQISGYINQVYQQNLSDYLSSSILQKAIEVDYSYYENPLYHDTLHLAQEQAMQRAIMLLSNFNAILQNLISLILMGSLLASLHWAYAILFIVLSLPLTFVKWYFGKKTFGLAKELAENERISHYLQQVLTGTSYAKEVRVYGFGNYFIDQFRRLRKKIFLTRRNLEKKQNFYSLLTELFEIIALAFLFISLAQSAWNKTITAGIFIIYLQGFQRLQSSARNWLQAMIQIYQQRLFIRHLFQFLDIPINKTFSTEYPFPDLSEGLILQDVSFQYEGTQKNVLNHINMQFKPGKIIAIVGENGSGKSTLIKLISQLYSIKEGTISLENIPINLINDNSFRKNSVILFQDFEKYFFSINENIALGDEVKFNQSNVIAAAGMSYAAEFINNLEQGYQTKLGRSFRNGAQLSGGQWQKIALSRVFYKDAKMILLDEPTSSLDALAEFQIFKSIQAIAEGRIIILITHRLYNIRFTDYIYVLKEGHIEEEGDFDNLKSKKGLFYSMLEKQEGN